ncbi:MAG: ABC transporter substrate-binding protein, partial [Archaeoglobaceae archaeon]
MFRKTAVIFVGIIIVMVALLGCAQPAPTPTPTPTPKPEEPIVICALFDPRVPVLKADAEAIKIAIEEINAKGGILGRKVEFVHEDTQRKVDIAVSAYRG